VGSGSIASTVTDITKSTSAHLDTSLIPIFLIGGAIGFGIFTFFLRKYAHKKIFSTDEEITNLMYDFWIKDLRPFFVDIMYNLTDDLMNAHKRHYETRSDGSLPDEETKLKNIISKIIPSEKVYFYEYNKNKTHKSSK
jgi:hypothetical protein